MQMYISNFYLYIDRYEYFRPTLGMKSPRRRFGCTFRVWKGSYKEAHIEKQNTPFLVLKEAIEYAKLWGIPMPIWIQVYFFIRICIWVLRAGGINAIPSPKITKH